MPGNLSAASIICHRLGDGDQFRERPEHDVLAEYIDLVSPAIRRIGGSRAMHVMHHRARPQPRQLDR